MHEANGETLINIFVLTREKTFFPREINSTMTSPVFFRQFRNIFVEIGLDLYDKYAKVINEAELCIAG